MEPEIPLAPYNLRLAIIGQSGVGKSCFVRTLFEFEYNSGKDDHIKKAKAHLEQGEKTVEINEFPPFKININATQVVNLTLIDTVGYGDAAHLEENWALILNDLQTRHQKGKSFAVDAVIYILEPCRIKGADVEFMKLLSENVALIPVIGKIDSMDPKQRISWRKELYSFLLDNSVKFFHLNDEKEILGVCGAESGTKRSYGFHEDIDIFDKTVSDMTKFKNLLYANYYHILEQKKQFHGKWKGLGPWTNAGQVIGAHRSFLRSVIYHLFLILTAFVFGKMYEQKISF